MGNFSLQLDKHGISKERYMELKYACLQYQEYQRRQSPSDVRRIHAIHQSALETDANLYPYILQNATRGVLFEALNVPCGRNYFYDVRRRFYIALDEKLRMIEIHRLTG